MPLKLLKLLHKRPHFWSFGSFWREGCDVNGESSAEDGRRQKRDSLTVLPGWNFAQVVVINFLTAKVCPVDGEACWCHFGRTGRNTLRSRSNRMHKSRVSKTLWCDSWLKILSSCSCMFSNSFNIVLLNVFISFRFSQHGFQSLASAGAIFF